MGPVNISCQIEKGLPEKDAGRMGPGGNGTLFKNGTSFLQVIVLGTWGVPKSISDTPRGGDFGISQP